MHRNRQAKIVVTLGPESDSEEVIEQLFLKGADVFRLNFSHGKNDEHKHKVQIIRSLEQKYNRPTTILLDLQGPKLRINIFEAGKINLKEGQTFCLDLINKPGNNDRVYFPHPEVFRVFQPDQKILLDDGKIILQIIEAGSDFTLTKVIRGGVLSNKKGVNIPDTQIPVSAITEKDKQDIEFGLTLDIDWIALSFVQDSVDIKNAREMIGNKTKIAVKIEKPQALQDLDRIVSFTDAVLVARGDLGVEMPLEEVPILQKKIIQTCHKYSKPVIVATQMLESMIKDSSPTRAEVSDVANAIYEGADAVMLSAETAVGKFPIQTVEMMDKIIKKTEGDKETWNRFYRVEKETEKKSFKKENICDAIVDGMHTISYAIDVKAVAVFSMSGYTAAKAANSRPKAPIITLTTDLKTARHLPLIWGVHPVIIHEVFSFTQMVRIAHNIVQNEISVQKGDMICIVSGIPFSKSGGGNILHIVKIDPDNIPNEI